MEFLDDSYMKIINFKGFDICTLKSVCPAKGDRFGYVIDDERFDGYEFDLLADAIDRISKLVFK